MESKIRFLKLNSLVTALAVSLADLEKKQEQSHFICIFFNSKITYWNSGISWELIIA